MSLGNLIRWGAVAALTLPGLLAQKPAAPEAPKAGVIPRSADGHPDLTGVWSNATRTPFERPAVFEGRATLSDEEAKAWEVGENARWAEGFNGPRPIESIQGGAYNLLDSPWTTTGRPREYFRLTAFGNRADYDTVVMNLAL